MPDFIQGGSPITNRKTIEKYKADPPKINVIVSTDAGAEGVNLQEGNVVINYDLPWNPMIVEQRIGRVQRLGSTFNEVLVFNPYAQGTIEEFIVDRLLLKMIGISQAIGDLEGILDIYGEDSESFEKQIENLVYSSLKKQDFEKNRLEIEKAVQEATQYYEEHRSEIDETISATNWNEELAEENLPPEIEPQHHSMAAQEFLAKAWEMNQPPYIYGGNPFLLADEIWNRPEELQNSREFKDCANDWRKRASSFVYDLNFNLARMNEAVQAVWLKQFPETRVERIDRSGRVDSDFQGQILFRAEVSNAVNRFQKVLSSPVETLGDSVPDYSLAETGIPEDFARQRNYNSEIARMVPNSSTLAQQTVERDEGLQRFARYYYNVLEAKQNSTVKMEVRRRNAENFTPNFSAEMCGIQGFTYEIFPLQIHFLADSHPYSVSVRWIPINRSFQPIATGHCEATGITCPEEILEECQLTHKKVLSHLLVTIRTGFRVLESETAVCGICHECDLKSTMEISPVNHLWEHIEHKIECCISHQKGFPEEMGTSDFSGRRAFSRFVQISGKTGRKGIIDEFVLCARTKEALLQEEARQSVVDGQWYDAELMQKSAISDRYELPENLVSCECTGVRVLPDERIDCCISGKKIRQDFALQSPISNRFFNRNLGIQTADGQILPPDEVCAICNRGIQLNEPWYRNANSGKKVHRSHFVMSSITKKIILKTEAMCSDYSKKYAEKNFFQTSVSGRIGLPHEFCACAKTNERLLKDEARFSNRNQCWYKCELCGQSDVSKDYGLPEDLIVCEYSQKKMFPEESGICAVSGKRVAKKFLVTSSVSGLTYLPEYGVNSIENRPLMKSEADFCRWQCGHIPKSEAGKCSLCGLTFSKKFLINGEFKQIHDLHQAISSSRNLKLRWPLIEPRFRSLLYNLPQYQPGFNVASPACLTRVLMNQNQRAFVFCTQTFVRKFLFFGTYVYYFGLAHIQNSKLVLLHKPLMLESPYDVWND